MKPVSKYKSKPNRLIQGLVGFSFFIHLLIFMYVTNIYRSEELSVIEVTMMDVSKPFQRPIPRPRVRLKVPKTAIVNKLEFKKHYIPPIKIDPVKFNQKNYKIESIEIPTALGVPGLSNTADLLGTPNVGNSSKFDIPDMTFPEKNEFITRKDYFEILIFKIESLKKYPESAKSNHIEGRIRVSFLITATGQVSSLKIIRRSRHNSLNQAALNAVKDSSPFPRPPAILFKIPLEIELNIVFELR